ncbi:MAG: hypoxanthine phosphoribosyltransferase [Bacteroidota bacterium]
MKIKDKSFKVLINEEELQKKIASIAKQINKDYKGKSPLFIGILNGSFMFVADMMKHVKLESKVSFIKLSSYSNMSSSGSIKELIGINENVFKKDIIILEDIIDTGLTMASVTEEFKERGASSVEIATMLLKPNSLQVELDIKYVGFEISDEFVVGYGLDYDGLGRNTRDIYQLKPS